MNRPTREQVDRALRDSERYADIGDFTESVAVTLAAEVRALREGYDKLAVECGHLQHENGRLRGVVDRVEALTAKWRERFVMLQHDERIVLARENCARDLEAALKGEP